MVYAPIYKDTYYVTTADTLTYTIELDGGVIYSGRAVKFPDADNLRININKVCNNYLESDMSELFDSESSYTINLNACRVFDLKNGNGVTLQQYTFLFDYDYGHNWSGGETTLSEPVNGHFVSGMLKPKTNVTASNAVRTYKSSGVYPVEVGCAEYVLYYLNARGGWDAFVIEGATVKKDTISQYKTDRTFDNNTYEFEANRYISEVKTSYEMNTNYLTDEESERLAKHLVGSNKVYLHNLNEGWIKPVLIDDTSVVYKKYQTNGKKLSQYKINVSDSQMKIRK